MYQTKGKPSDSSALTEDQQLANQSLSQGFRPERTYCVSAEREKLLRWE
jgi:hypothetical protein